MGSIGERKSSKRKTSFPDPIAGRGRGFSGALILDKASLLESLECAVLVDGLDGSS